MPSNDFEQLDLVTPERSLRVRFIHGDVSSHTINKVRQECTRRGLSLVLDTREPQQWKIMGRILQFDPDIEPQDCNILTEPTDELTQFTCDDLPTHDYYKIASVGPNGDTVKPYFCFRVLEYALKYIDQQQERGFRGRIDIQHFHRVSGGVERPIIADFRVTDEGIINLSARHSQ